MSRFRMLLVAGLLALACLALAASSASATANDEHASCLGTLSSFAGSLQLRDDFAPQPGDVVSFGAQQHFDLATCLSGVPTG
jgi:hypothetical protein